MALVGLVIDVRACRDPHFIADDLEETGRVVGDSVSMRIPGIRISRAQDGRDRSLGGVLVDRTAGQRDVGRRLVDQVVDRDRDDFGVRIARSIGRLDREVMGLVGLVVDIRACRDPDLVADDLEEAGRVVRNGVGMRVTRIRIDRAQDGRNGSLRRAFVDGTATGQRDVGRGLIGQVVDRECDDLGVRVAPGIGGFDRNVVALVGLEIDIGACRDADLIADDLEVAGRIVRDRIGMAVARIHIDGAQGGDRRACRRTFIDRAAGERDVARRLIDIVHGQRDDFTVRVARGIGCLHGDVMGLVGLEVDCGACRDAHLVADDLEEAGRIVRDGIGVAVTRIGVGRA